MSLVSDEMLMLTADRPGPALGARVGPSQKSGWAAALSGAAVLGAIACFLPVPWSARAWMSARPQIGFPGAVDAAALTVGSLMTWALLGWLTVILGAAGLSRLPGRVGRYGLRGLRRLAPVAVRGALVGAVGLAVLGSAAACGTASGHGPGTGAAAGALSQPRVSSTSSSTAFDQCAAAAQTGPSTARARLSPSSFASSSPSGGGVASPGTSPGRRIDLPSVAGTALPTAPTPPRHSVAAAQGTGTGTGKGPDGVDIDWPAGPSGVDPGRPATGTSDPGSSDPGQAPAQAPAAPRADPGGEVVVLRGDSLWAIAQRHLPAGASATAIDTQWHRWYLTNRAVIGDDPNLILPGQRLLAPSAPGGSR